jgi:hypothetical protein
MGLRSKGKFFMKKSSVFYSVLLCLTMNGCSSLKAVQYSDPATNPSAKLSLKMANGSGFKDGGIVSGTVYAVVFNGTEKCTEPRYIQKGSEQHAKLISEGVPIRANALLSMMVGLPLSSSFIGGAINIQSCDSMIRFTPIAGKNYTAYLSADSKGCGLDLRSDNNQSEPYERLQKLKPFDMNGEFCKSL